MAYSYDLATDIGKVRLLATDNLEDEPMFQDEEIQVFLDLNGTVRLAAAQALETIAVNELLVMKRIISMNLQLDGPSCARALKELAANLRQQEEDLCGIDIAETTNSIFSTRDRIMNQIFRRVV